MRAIKTLLVNKVFGYICFRYTAYGLQFLNSILIGIYLGPYFLGIWGFFQLIILIFKQVNFGVPESLNNIISINKSNKEKVQKTFNSAFLLMIVISSFTGILLFINSILPFEMGAEYMFSEYIWLIFLIITTNYLNAIFMNLFRVFNKFVEINFYQLLPQIVILTTLLTVSQSKLLSGLLWAYAGSQMLSFLIFLRNTPIQIKPVFPFSIIKEIQKKGLTLFLYNCSFYMILISTRTIISSNYTVSEFGLFTFSFTCASVILLLLDSFSFLLFPKMINRFSNINNKSTKEILGLTRKIYVTGAHLITHSAIFLYPLLINFAPQYSVTIKAFSLIALVQLLYVSSFGYPVLLMARNKEKKLGTLAFIHLIINVLSILFLVLVFHVDYYFVILGTAITYISYSVSLYIESENELNQKVKVNKVINSLFPIRILVPIVSSFSITISELDPRLYIISLISFVLLNFKKITYSYRAGKNLLTNPSLISI